MRCLWVDGRGQCRRTAVVDSWPTHCQQHKKNSVDERPPGMTDAEWYWESGHSDAEHERDAIARREQEAEDRWMEDGT